jgi:iron complex transport system permease protein
LSKKNILIFCLFIIIFISAFIFSIKAGPTPLSFKKITSYLLHPEITDEKSDIIWKIRLPRIILGILVGAGLALCGTVFQGILRNPLAEPYTLGVSGGAALGVSLGFILNLSLIYLPFFAFIGSGLTIFLVYTIAAKKQFSNFTLLLTGVVISFLSSSLVFLIFALAKPEDVYGIIFWLMGNLSTTETELIKIIPFFIIPFMILLFIFARDLNILTLGEEKAKHLGVNSKQIKKLLFITASGITAVCVSASGIIGFVGLIIPHFIRKIVGADHRLVLPAACINGASFLILSDAVARTIFQPLELPVGVITGICGGLFFLIVLLISKKWQY